jgi:hypothetical protein
VKVKARPARETTADLFRRLRLRDSRQTGVVVLCEVGNGAGFGNSGWTDAVSMQTWPSKELTITGYEVKATRADWLRELNSPDKNRTWQKHCHEWYVVAPSKIVELAELPAGWGLMVPSGNDGLRIAARAQMKPTESIPLKLVAAIFRAAANERQRFERAARDELRKEEEQRLGESLERHRREAREWEQRHMELVEALGNRWESMDKLRARAEAVRALEGDDRLRTKLEQLRIDHERRVETLKRVEKDLAAAEGDDECTGRGTCHGPLQWCARCGDVSNVCDDPACDAHREAS